MTVEGGASPPFDAFLYEPAGPARGALLVQAGLHYLGPADRRMDRFLAILADVGFVAFSPHLPDMRRMWMDRRQIDDLHAALRTFRADPAFPRAYRPGMFSISFGSYPTLHVAAREGRGVGGVVVFGGFANFPDAVRFALRGDKTRPPDPLNTPAIFLNIFDDLEDLPADEGSREALRAAWIGYLRETWGRPYMRDPAYHRPVARRVAARLPEDARALFEKVVGLRPGGPELLEPTFRRVARLPDFRMAEACAKVAGPVVVAHGRQDDVIPYEESIRLGAMFRPEARAKVFLTGLYAHTGQESVGLPALRQELQSMWGMVAGIVDAARLPALPG